MTWRIAINKTWPPRKSSFSPLQMGKVPIAILSCFTTRIRSWGQCWEKCMLKNVKIEIFGPGKAKTGCIPKPALRQNPKNRTLPAFRAVATHMPAAVKCVRNDDPCIRYKPGFAFHAFNTDRCLAVLFDYMYMTQRHFNLRKRSRGAELALLAVGYQAASKAQRVCAWHLQIASVWPETADGERSP